MSLFRIFIVEDDEWYSEWLKYNLTANPDNEVFVFKTGKDCLANLFSKPDVVCIDFKLPDTTGDKLLSQIRSVNQNIPVVVISGQEDVSIAVDLLRSGAHDYIVKDDHAKEVLWNAVERIKETSGLRQEIETLKVKLGQKYSFEKTLIGQSAAIRKTYTVIEKAINTNVNVSISGETGTGKEVVAKAIHFNGRRKDRPFVAVNMAAIPRELVESELFGHEKGSFTGAVDKKIGKFEEANGGTLFLDEIAELDLNVQSKLLRVLQERELVRVGGVKTIPLDIRIITASHKDLAEEVRKKTFREDLYYRILGLPIELPPLRARGNDVLILAKHFIADFVRENKCGQITFSEDAKTKLLNYAYPGNVRELKSVVELAAVMCEEGEIKSDDITFRNLNAGEVYAGDERTLKEYTADIIAYYMKKYNNNVIEVARRLDIGKSSIYNMINRNEIKK
ncbi:MAG: sigma-54-dependent Fis family transcriptional regulator [Bacteroidetes bacterium]|nr:sigma-54-dependent Fis family transcriptional regulator [Bacteroidota bacterium]